MRLFEGEEGKQKGKKMTETQMRWIRDAAGTPVGDNWVIFDQNGKCIAMHVETYRAQRWMRMYPGSTKMRTSEYAAQLLAR